MARRTTSSLWLLSCLLVFFCGHVFAASAVLGVDLGTEYIKAALVKPGIPLEIVLTKDSRRKETSAVAFKPPPGGPKPGVYPERAYGSDAMALAARFPGDVYPNLKPLLGLTVDGGDNSRVVKEYAARHPALQLAAHPVRKTAAFKSSGAFAPDEDAWLVEELLAMELQSVRRSAEALAGPDTAVRSVVLTVPPFYTAEEKRAVELAADLAGLRVLSLISDGLAVGLHYATSRQFPNVNEGGSGGKPEVHMVFDMGAGATKATLLQFQSRTVKDVGKFNKTVQEVQVLGSGWDRTLGGDALNALIVDDMVAQFVASAGAKAASVSAAAVRAHGRTVAKLAKEAERVRHVLSANTQTTASFEGLYEDVDFRYKLSRADFEAMVASHDAAARVTAAIEDALAMAGGGGGSRRWGVADVDSVILHGGATRTPFVQKQLEQIFGGAEKLRTNVNADEAAVFGAGFRAAELSPSFRVKEIRVADGAAYGAGMAWTNTKNNNQKKIQNQQLWTPTSHLGAPAKEVTFQNKEDFSVRFYQIVPPSAAAGDDAVQADVEVPTKLLTTTNLTATVALLGEKYGCEPAAVQFKVGLRLNSEDGEVEVSKATVSCEAEDTEKEGIMDGVKNLFGFGKQKDQQPLKEGEDAEVVEEKEKESSSSSSSTATPSSGSATASTDSTSSSSSSDPSAASSVAASASPDAKADGAKKKVTITIPVKYELVKTGIPQLSKADTQKLKDRLKAFAASDRARLQREETFNQLEGFTYKVRGLLDNAAFVAVSTEAERAALAALSHETSEWLYGAGADATRDELQAKFAVLRDAVDPIEARITEAEQRPALVAGLKEALQQSWDFSKSIRERIAEYEQFQSSKSASSATTTTTATTTTSAEAATASDEFAGLEDDDAAAGPGTGTGTGSGTDTDEPVLADRGPVPPLYTVEDLKASEDLHASVAAWLAEKEAAQAKLGPTDDPVLTTRDLQAKRNELDKVGMDLAMRAVRHYESEQQKQKQQQKSKSKSKSKASASAKSKSKTSKAKKASDTSSTTTTSATATSSSATPPDGQKGGGIKHEEL
ncbi:hsp70 family chaperone lhs1 [Niveomyces insectorum RCEF 264]|uniref:Hsp70 family chaperone lhs1 n=1 Tax=Niveomyces insectorum RCEF 264 TaxID=1081102 RepID=A0A167QC73_9HYPO|nr:hsp70 family chaperone lhs1 [Niveomyces insectorum RCEF 264]